MERTTGTTEETGSRVETAKETWDRLEDIDGKKIQQDEVLVKEARNLLKVKDVLMAASTPLEIYIPELEGKIVYCRLTYAEMAEVAEIEDRVEAGMVKLYRHLHKADASISEESVRGLPAMWVTLMNTRISVAESRFLLPALNDVTTISEATRRA